MCIHANEFTTREAFGRDNSKQTVIHELTILSTAYHESQKCCSNQKGADSQNLSLLQNGATVFTEGEKLKKVS